MDFGDVFGLVGRFFIDYCNISITLFDVRFTIGSLFLWSALAVLIIGWIRSIRS